MAKKTDHFIRFLGYVKPYWKDVLFGTLGGVVKFTVPLLVPQATRYLLDSVFLSTALSPAEKIHELLFTIGGLILIFIVFWTPWTYVRHYLTARGGNQSVFDLRSELYEHILRMSASFFERNRSGSIVSRLISDIQLAQNLVGSALTNVWMDAISVVVILYFLFRIDVKSTLVALITFPLYVFIFKGMGNRIRSTTHKVQEKIADMSGNIQEKVAGSAVVHAFTQEEKEGEVFQQESDNLFTLTMKQSYYQSLNVTLNGLLVSIAPLLVTLYCGYQVIQGHITIGDMVAVSLYLGPLYLPVQRFSELNVVFSNSMAALDRIFNIIDETPDIQDKPGALPLESVEGKVEFKDVCFFYPNNVPEQEQACILEDIHFSVEPGQRVALVGPSGAGKSTLVTLIPRFYDVRNGAVILDGHDVRDLQVKSLRKHIGVVMQDAILFSGTIEENLRYGEPDASPEELIAACKAANALDFILSSPNGFQSEVGEGGSFLSGGQKQRLTIARAFLKNPKILILDEATAALDAEAERLVKEALQNLMVGRTTFIIAHRLSTIVNSDKIFVLKDGRIVEEGTHEELLRLGGLYHHLYSQQFESAELSMDFLKNSD
jgi:ATP-binding cassette, subfamily B, putative efflux pump